MKEIIKNEKHLAERMRGAFFMQRKENTKWQKMIFLK